MATVRSGSKGALLVIDAQVGVLETCQDRDRVVAAMAAAMAKARAADVPIIIVQHVDDRELPEGDPRWRLVPELPVSDRDVRISKRYNSAFEGTGLEKILDEAGVSRLVVAGAATNWCIRATVFGALAKGYDVTLVADAHTTEDLVLSKERKIPASDLIDELNVGIEYVEYPGIETAVVRAEELAL